MPYCPKCKSEYRDEFDRCAECDVALTPTPPKPQPEEGWVVVFSGDAARRTVAQAALESAGIETQAPDDATFNIAPYHFGVQGFQVPLLVMNKDLARAKKILEGEFSLKKNPNESPDV